MRTVSSVTRRDQLGYPCPLPLRRRRCQALAGLWLRLGLDVWTWAGRSAMAVDDMSKDEGFESFQGREEGHDRSTGEPLPTSPTRVEVVLGPQDVRTQPTQLGAVVYLDSSGMGRRCMCKATCRLWSRGRFPVIHTPNQLREIHADGTTLCPSPLTKPRIQQHFDILTRKSKKLFHGCSIPPDTLQHGFQQVFSSREQRRQA